VFRTATAQNLPPRLAALTGHLVVALLVLVVIGGATRVMEAGLACPDWPLCYGQWLPGGQLNTQVFLEWFHRLDAFVVGVALLVLAATSLLARRILPAWLPGTALLALVLVAVQGGLGALTVTRLLAAPLVTAHLATALVLVALLSGVHQALRVIGMPRSLRAASPSLPTWWIAMVTLALLLLIGQCVLGGELASTWAAERCLSVADGCAALLRHRIGARAAAPTVVLLLPASLAIAGGRGWLRRAALAAALLVGVQIALGVTTLRFSLSLPLVTIAHQAGAALLVGLVSGCLGRSLALASTVFPSNSPAPSAMAASPAPNPGKVAHG
jgi:cytochrome c oxidase assembly protein subunit 15